MHIIMKIAMALLATFGWVSLLQAQTRLTGTVQDSATGEALSGAYVFTRGDATSTEAQGTFSLAWDGASPIEVRFLGYQTRVLVPTQNPVNIRLAPAAAPLKEVVVSPLRATANTPVAYTNLSAEELAARNDGRDIPLILNQTPSMVTTSDAGAGIGYTGMRIRGSDITRINVTINDIPLNDPESHGVFWVNTPDLVSSTSSIQVQRGVGTSTNGAGAFGASIHLETGNQTTPYGQLTLGGGSFGTYRANVAFGSGLLNQRWVVEGRLSTIQSEGFVDRARANLTSHYLQASYLGERTRIRAVQFSGREETYQAWYGIPEARFRGDVQGMVDYTVRNGLSTSDSLNLLQSGNTTYNFYTYANEVDNYGQDHYQLHWDQVIRPNLNLRISGHYTRGKGYFEQYRNEDALASYNLPPVVLGADTVFTTDLVRRRWLDNHFYGAVGAITYSTGDVEAVLGGAINRYEGLHYGEIIWAQFASTAQPGDRYYNGSSIKDDANVYARITKSLGKRFQVYADLQLRRVFYQTGGTDNDLRAISADQTYFFFNPKAGIQYNQNNGTWYLSYAQANREPVRNDFIDSPT